MTANGVNQNCMNHCPMFSKKENWQCQVLERKRGLSKTLTCKILHGGQQEEEELHKNRMAVREQALLTLCCAMINSSMFPRFWG
jgi:hypothetical protein